MTKKKTLQSIEPRVAPSHRSRWFEYVEEDAEEGEVPYRLRVRTNITYGELQALIDEAEGKKEDRELWPLIAPFVTQWNISGGDANGEDVEIPPPAVGGPEQFEHIPPQLFSALYRDVMLRSTPPLARKTAQRSAPMPEPPSGGE